MADDSEDYGLGDDFDDYDDFDDGDGDEDDGARGHAAVLCTRATTGVTQRLFDSVDEALRAAERPCAHRKCLRDHTVAYRDADGDLRTLATPGSGAAALERLKEINRAQQQAQKARYMARMAARDAQRREARRDD